MTGLKTLSIVKLFMKIQDNFEQNQPNKIADKIGRQKLAFDDDPFTHVLELIK